MELLYRLHVANTQQKKRFDFQSSPFPTFFELQELFNLQHGLCAKCSRDITEHFSLDHIIPYAFDGEHTIVNLQFLCKRCNTIKGPKQSAVAEWQRQNWPQPYVRPVDWD